MPKLIGKNVPYTKTEINEILSLKGWLDSEIDVFTLYAVLTIGVTNKTHGGPGDSWNVTQKTYLEKALDIKLEYFTDCMNRAEVRKRFRQVMQKAVSNAIFPGDKVF